LTEAIDIWSLGNSFYGLWTGLNPLYDSPKMDNGNDAEEGVVPNTNAWKRIVKCETAFIDPRYSQRSKAEKKKCFEYDPVDRPTIFEIVDELGRAVRELYDTRIDFTRVITMRLLAQN
jgi:serine/threonine protein kinase